VDNPFSNLTDEDLMELYQNGDALAFETIYYRHKDKIYTYLQKRLTNKEQIDDLFQSILVKFHKSRHLYEKKYLLLKWLYTICRSELLDFAKKRKVQLVELNDKHIGISTEEEDRQIDIDCESTLSEKEKNAIKLRYYSDQDFNEISKVLNTSESNTRKIISRGLKKLRLKYMGDSK
jgi:RNA polymerase sigma-70 factor (ECF subfamily)